MDQYIEHFIVDESVALRELDRLRREYGCAGHYPCNGGFVVWADRLSEEDIPEVA